MAVYKANVQEQFLVVKNETARNENLSLEAKGLILVMGSRPNDWKFNKSQLMKESGVGKDKLNRIFKELVEHGYLAIAQRHDDQGRFIENDYYFFTDPSNNPAFIPLTEKPLTDNTVYGKSAPTKERVNTKERSKQNVQPIVEQGFDIFWKYYPKKVSKQAAKKSYEKLMKGKTDEQVQDLTETMVDYIADALEQLEAGNNHFIGYDNLNASTYINQKRWEDC